MDLRFETPWLLVLLAALPLLAAYAWPRRGAAAGVRLGSLAPAANVRPTWRVRLEPLLVLLRILGIGLLIVAIAGPQRGEATAADQGEGIDIVLAFDVSTSMTQPFGGQTTRLDAAKDVLSNFVETRKDDRVALVAFQGSAITLSPLTTDYAALEEAIRGADRLVLADGTAIGSALGESVNVLRGSTAASRIVILMTDGENNAGEVQPLAAARIAERLGARVYTVGVIGTGSRGIRSTQEVDEAALKQIAEVTDATYSPATNETSLAETYRRIDQLEESRFAGEEFTRYGLIAPIFLAGAALALAAELLLRATAFRRAA
jgi:Ca-activated chloride channel family protein